MRIFLQTILLFIFLNSHPAVKGQTFPLYSGKIPQSLVTEDQEVRHNGSDPAVTKVSRPTLTAYIPEKKSATGAGIVICPGGGYGSLMIEREGHAVARSLRDKGISAFVLKYRLPDASVMINRAAGPLQDAQQAISLIRSKAQEFRIDADKLGIMGFSAGGHLAASAGILDTVLLEGLTRSQVRPNFMILVYPVITMDTVMGHRGSTANLLGEKPLLDEVHHYSLQHQVGPGTPPVFITVAEDDQLVSHSMTLYTALHKNQVPVELHLFAYGKHGFIDYPPYEEWSRLFLNWMKKNNWFH